MRLQDLVEASRTVRQTRSRRAKVAALAACLRRAEPSQAAFAVAYLAGRLPQGRLGVGPALVYQAASAVGTGSLAVLTLAELGAALGRIQAASGAGSTEARRAELCALFARATAEEQDFLVRLLLGELRQGALEGLMAEALAEAAAVPLAEVRTALMLEHDAGRVAEALLGEGRAALERFRLRPLQPVRPMLAQTAADIGEALERLGTAAFEYKLDGARVQLHKLGDEVRAYTRRLHEVSESVPELVALMRALPAQALIVDGEAIVLQADGRPQPFQITMSRFSRRLGIEAGRQESPLTVFLFDCLHHNGIDLIAERADARFDALRAVAPGAVIPRLVTADPLAAQDFLDEALARGHEGVMAKALDAPYEAGNRGYAWLKIKPAATLDLVMLAAEWGHGRRQGWLSNLHLGARDPATGTYVMLGKTFKGMTDAMLEWQTRRLLELEERRDAYTVYVRPELVVEVAFNDVQASPHYPGGLALRFARVKGYRPDKAAAEADTIDAVRVLHQRARRQPSETG